MLRADVPLPVFKPASAADQIDITVSVAHEPPFLGYVNWHPHPRIGIRADWQVEGVPFLEVAESADGIYMRLRYYNGTQFILTRAGTHVWVAWSQPATFDTALNMLANPILGLCLHLRGIVPLHASAVLIGGQAVLFAGHSGHGKSTTASLFARHGHSVITDDIAAINAGAPLHGADVFCVQTGYPYVRLYDETAAAMLGNASPEIDLRTPKDKAYFNPNAQFETTNDGQPVPISAIYLLVARGDNPQMIRAKPIMALVSLSDKLYLNTLIDDAMRAGAFHVLSRMVERVPVYLLAAPDGLDKLDALYEAVLTTAAITS